MSARKKAHCDDALAWLKTRGWSLAPLTGQDVPCLQAISHCWSLYFKSDTSGQAAAVVAVAALLDGCQEVCWPMARELIAHAGDWGHRDELWPKVVSLFRQRTLPDRDAKRVDRLARCHVGLRLVEGGA
jgi:lambda repressor-like predicted transcriptional regulator